MSKRQAQPSVPSSYFGERRDASIVVVPIESMVRIELRTPCPILGLLSGLLIGHVASGADGAQLWVLRLPTLPNGVEGRGGVRLQGIRYVTKDSGDDCVHCQLKATPSTFQHDLPKRQVTSIGDSSLQGSGGGGSDEPAAADELSQTEQMPTRPSCSLEVDPIFSQVDAIEACVHPHGSSPVELFWRHVRPCYPILSKHPFAFALAYSQSYRRIPAVLLSSVYLSAIR